MMPTASENIVVRSLSQIGDCGLFLLRMIAAIPRSMRHYRETIRQLWFVGRSEERRVGKECS